MAEKNLTWRNCILIFFLSLGEMCSDRRKEVTFGGCTAVVYMYHICVEG